MIRSYIAVVFVTSLLFPALAQAEENITGTTLEISAAAESKAAPDIATISAGVTTQTTSPTKGLQENTVKMDAVFKALKAAGIADKDIQTSDISFEPRYAEETNSNKAPRIISYQVNNTVSVTIRNITNIGNVLDALIAQGANQLNGPAFSVEDNSAAVDQARKAALEKAQKSAAAYAAAAGLKIKRIISISELQQGIEMPRPHPMMRAMAMSAMQAVTPVAPGQVTTDITIDVRYELTP